MDFNRLNPIVRDAGIYERIARTETARAYDARLLFMLSGDVQLTADGKKQGHLTPGNLVYIPAGMPYAIKGTFLRMAVFSFDLTAENPHTVYKKIPPDAAEDFREAECRTEADAAPFDRLLFLPDMTAAREEIEKMTEIFTGGEGPFRAEVSAMLKLLLLRVAEAVDEDALPTRMVRTLDAYIRERCGEEISNTEVGAIFGYHPFYVSKLLKDKKGITLHQYILNYRLRLAENLLTHTPRSINDISAMCGFADPSYFTKSFKAAYGVTPKEYRNRAAEAFL